MSTKSHPRFHLRFLLYLFLLLIFPPFVVASEGGDRPREVSSASSLNPSNPLPDAWLKLYQYKRRTFGRFVSDVASPQFFFSPEGGSNPEKEFRVAIEAFESTEKVYGIQKQPAACVFPARRLVLERILGRSFPRVDCPDLRDWLQRLNVDRVSIVFAGAYGGNPASILGHTFLRFSSSSEQMSGRAGSDLLSYAVGFMARTDPSDNRALYMVKGLTGGYPGFYEIEPHYMKVGLYNNSESRDLWDVELDLTRQETELLALHLWEVTFNARIDYYFLDENCAFRLLSLIEAVRPGLRLTESLPLIVLPSETVRVLARVGLTRGTLGFRASIKRRLELKVALLDDKSLQAFAVARTSEGETRRLGDATALDALLDHWLYENYRAHAQLPSERAAIMEAAFERAAQVPESSRFQMSNGEIRDRLELEPPFQGHSPRWVQLRLARADERAGVGLSYRSGIQPRWLDDPGYREVAAIEYLGFDLDWPSLGSGDESGRIFDERGRDPQWNLVLVDVRSIENITGSDPHPSWMASIGASNICYLCWDGNKSDRVRAGVNAAVGIGAAVRRARASTYLFAHLESRAWERDGAQGLLAPGLVAGAKLSGRDFGGMGSLSLMIEGSSHWWKRDREMKYEAQLTYAWEHDRGVFLRLEGRDIVRNGAPGTLQVAEWERIQSVGFVQFFN